MKSKYIVTRKEVHALDYEVIAESAQEAKEKVTGGEANPLQAKYDTYLYSLDYDEWDVEVPAPISSTKFSTKGRV